MKIIVIILLILSICGCDNNKYMRENRSVPFVVTDDSGKRYIVEHYVGSHYGIKALPDCPEKNIKCQ